MPLPAELARSAEDGAQRRPQAGQRPKAALDYVQKLITQQP
ncbi:MAG: hypothetical protein ACXV3F_11110 [Frankiaceae bacterium]